MKSIYLVQYRRPDFPEESSSNCKLGIYVQCSLRIRADYASNAIPAPLISRIMVA